MKTTVLRQIDPPPAAANDAATRYCGSCGYDLRGAVEARCPECGEEFDPIAPPVANVPWFHRRTIGTSAALWRTAWLVMLQTQRLVNEMKRDTTLDRASAQSFRWICVGVAGCSTAVAIAMAIDPRPPAHIGFTLLALPLLAFFHLVTVLMYPTRFESPGRLARFEILHDFTAAPLLLMPIVPIASALFLLFDRDPIVAILPGGLVLVVWMACNLWYQTYAAGREAIRRLMHALLVVMVSASFALVCFMMTIFLIVLSRRLIGW
jgi:hypothetical protein